MLRTKHNEVLATPYIPNIASLRPCLLCCKFHSLKNIIKKGYDQFNILIFRKTVRKGLVECHKLSLCSKQVTQF